MVCMYIYIYYKEQQTDPDTFVFFSFEEMVGMYIAMKPGYKVITELDHPTIPLTAWSSLFPRTYAVIFAVIHPASRGVAAHTAGLFRSVRGAKGGFPPWGLFKLRSFNKKSFQNIVFDSVFPMFPVKQTVIYAFFAIKAVNPSKTLLLTVFL